MLTAQPEAKTQTLIDFIPYIHCDGCGKTCGKRTESRAPSNMSCENTRYTDMSAGDSSAPAETTRESYVWQKHLLFFHDTVL